MPLNSCRANTSPFKQRLKIRGHSSKGQAGHHNYGSHAMLHKNLHITLYKVSSRVFLWDEWMYFQCHINTPRKISDFSFFLCLNMNLKRKCNLKLHSLQAENSLEEAGLLCSTEGYYFLSSYMYFKGICHQIKPPFVVKGRYSKLQIWSWKHLMMDFMFFVHIATKTVTNRI